MNIFKGSYTWWQIGLLKLALLAIGVAIGATWPTLFSEYASMLAAAGLVLGIYLAFAWMRQPRGQALHRI